MAYNQGETGNKGGRPKLTDKQRNVAKMTKDTFAELNEKMMTLTREELTDLIAGSLPYEAELFIIHMLDMGQNPNWADYERYLSRRIGKVADHVEISLPKPTIIQLSGDRQIVLGNELQEDDE